jgi:hypothetical protein
MEHGGHMYDLKSRNSKNIWLTLELELVSDLTQLSKLPLSSTFACWVFSSRLTDSSLLQQARLNVYEVAC